MGFNEHTDIPFEPGTLQSQAPLCPIPLCVSALPMEPILPLNPASAKLVALARRDAFIPVQSITLFLKPSLNSFFCILKCVLPVICVVLKPTCYYSVAFLFSGAERVYFSTERALLF